MGLPLPAGHVLVRLPDDPSGSGELVLDALERAFPGHTGRGRSRPDNPWEDPAVLTSQGRWTVAGPAPDGSGYRPGRGPQRVWSEAFDTHGGLHPALPVPLDRPLDASALGAAEDLARLVRVLERVVGARERGRAGSGPLVEVRLRLGPSGD